MNEVASAESHRVLGPFSFFHFSVFFASFFGDKKRLRSSGLVPAMSTFATPVRHASTRVLRIFLAKRVEENHRCDAFLAKKGDGAELAPSRWMALLRRHFDASERAANPTVSWVLFHCCRKTKCLLEPPKLLKGHRYAHTGWQQKRAPEEGGIGRTSTIRNSLHAFQAPSMTA